MRGDPGHRGGANGRGGQHCTATGRATRSSSDDIHMNINNGYDSTQPAQPLKIIYSNVNGWTELNSHIRITALKHLNPDIICLGQTHLKNDKMITICNYVPYDHKRQHIHVNAPKGLGGVYVSVKNSIYNDYKITELDKCYEGILA